MVSMGGFRRESPRDVRREIVRWSLESGGCEGIGTVDVGYDLFGNTFNTVLRVSVLLP